MPVIAILIFIQATVEMATDIFLPSLPLLSCLFHVPEDQIQMTISMNLLGLGLSALVAGSVSDVIGRKKILALGMALFTISSLFCFFVTTLENLVFYRFLQGLGGGVPLAIVFAIIRDLYEEKECAKYISILGSVVGVSPAIAPLFGGYIAAYAGWQYCFMVLFLAGLICTSVLIKYLPETQREKKSFTPSQFLKNYFIPLSSLSFLSYAFISALALSGLWSVLAGFPYVFMESLGVKSEHFGFYSLVGVLSYLSGTLFNQRAVEWWPLKRLLGIGVTMALLGGGCMMALALLRIETPLNLQMANMVQSFGLALIFSAASTKALQTVPQAAGTGAALLAAFELLAASLGTQMVAEFYDGTAFPIAFQVVLCNALSLVILLVRRS